ncbi:SRPBCC domain-containing protein [Mucilaginibacter hurinus]|uniref:SRPBCC domain-containing protein n=1 Tax=Mucilaginibacter hurinus TaxID=2201324 RepID=A0A367GN01_9SPHI|nr:SRPBCC domain-containing protein [Mucilaginibacter hurinus]
MNAAPGDIVITRLIDAPAELVFAAWTNVSHLQKWFAPEGCSIKFMHADIREGGTFHSCVTVPGYGDCWCLGEYLEIVPDKKIVYTMINADQHGNKVADAGKDSEWPLETTVTILIKPFNGKTKLILHQNAPEAVAKRTGAYPSWLQMLDNLEKSLSQDSI